MIDKTSEIKAFLSEHYLPGELKSTKKDLQLSSRDVLTLLFQVYPIGCIDDYELHEILTQLGYSPQKKGTSEFVWCLKEK